MWHSQQVQQTRQGLANGGKYLQSEPNSWEDLLDSGCLDRQLSQMNFNGGHHQHQPHHQQQQQQRGPVPTRQPVPLMSVMQPPPPHLLGHLINGGNSNNNSNGLLGRQPPPPLMSQTVVPPRPRYQQRVPHQQQFQPHPSTFIVRQPQQRVNGMSQAIPPRATMIDTSVPPPRLPHFQPPPRPVLLQRPPPPVMKGPLTNTDLSAPFSNNTPTVKIVGEDEHRTQYTAPGPKVKILKRPSSTPSNLSSQGGGSDGSSENDVNGSNGTLNNAMKSLKQREEEYAQARLRILGSTGAEPGAGLTQETESK